MFRILFDHRIEPYTSLLVAVNTLHIRACVRIMRTLYLMCEITKVTYPMLIFRSQRMTHIILRNQQHKKHTTVHCSSLSLSASHATTATRATCSLCLLCCLRLGGRGRDVVLSQGRISAQFGLATAHVAQRQVPVNDIPKIVKRDTIRNRRRVVCSTEVRVPSR